MAYKFKKTRKSPLRTLKRGGTKTKRVIAKAKTQSLVRLIKKVALKPVETKQAFTLVENIQLYHNSVNIKQDMLYTKQGITDNDTGTSQYNNRIGDSVVARGLSLKFWLANKYDRPNIMYRIVVFRYTSGDTVTADDIFNNASTNIMLKDLNTERIKVLYTKIINLQVGSTVTANSATQATANFGKEAHKLIKVWIPLKNKILKYDGDNSGVPKWSDIGFCVVPYDSYGTLTTDNVASYAYHSKFYFKDP